MSNLFKRVFSKKNAMFFVVVAMLAFVGGSVAVLANDEQVVSSAREYDGNAIIRGGVGSKSELAGDYRTLQRNGDATGLGAFANAGVTPGNFGQTVLGRVTKDNKVYVGDKLVATNVYTYGRQKIGASDRQIAGGAWMRHPSTSFVSHSIPAFVYMKDGVFKWAVITSCGNPVKGTATKTHNPKVAIDKRVDKSVVEVGEVFNYTITIRNTGNVPLHNVVGTDLLPDGIRLANGHQNAKVIGRFGTLQPGEKKVWKLKVKAKPGVQKNVSLRNLACVNTHVNPDPTHLPFCDDAHVIVKASPSFKIEKTSEVDVVKPGQEFDYTLTVTNNGEVDLFGVDVGDQLPDGLEPVLPNDDIIYNENTGLVNFRPKFRLNVGQSATRTLKVRVTDDTNATMLRNIACVVTDTTGGAIHCDDDKVILKHPEVVCRALVADPSEAFVPANVTFTAEAEAIDGATIDSYQFDPGDGSGVIDSNDNTAVHSYTTSGDFTAKVTVQTSEGPVTSNDCETPVKIKQKVDPKFVCTNLEASATEGDAPFTVDFTASADVENAVIEGYDFDFGDDNSESSDDNTVSHEYTTPGNYTASVQVRTSEGTTPVTEDCQVNITVNEVQEPMFACNALNVATVDADGQLPFNVNFSTDATAENGAVIQSYNFDFGDGETLNSPVPDVSHSYTQEGVFTATVQVVTNVGTTPISEACSVEITVTDEQPRFVCTDLIVEPQAGVAPFEVKFTATGEVENAVIQSYTFSFGDGSADVTTDQNMVMHTYQNPGDYNASVVINTDQGSTDPADCRVTINAQEEPVCPYNPELPVGHPDCKPPVVCEYNPQLPPNHPDCKKPEVCKYNPALSPDDPRCVEDEEEAPTFLPRTGAGAAAVVGGGSMFAAAGAYMRSRKELFSSLINN